MISITEEEFKKFKEVVYKWANIMGLRSWKLDVTLEEVDEDAYAFANFSAADKHVVITLNSKLSEYSYQMRDFEMTAFHEVMEVFLYPLVAAATNRFSTMDAIVTANHTIIRTLENTLYKTVNPS